MSRPSTTINITAAVPRRGANSATGTAFLLYAGATGATTPTRCLSAVEAAETGAPAPIVAYVSDALFYGAPEVVLLRVTAVDASAVTEAEWTTGLSKLTDAYSPGQVIIPGVFTPAARAALLAHANRFGRCALLDVDPAATAAATVTAAAGIAASAGAKTSTLVTGVTLAGLGGEPRTVPGSVVVAGLTARGDAFVGHANNAPIFDQGRGAGYIARAVGVPKLFTNDELDALHDAGVSVIRPIAGVIQLAGWVSLSDDERFHQLNAGRMQMQLLVGVAGGAQQFLGRQIDGKGQLFAELEGALRGYLQPLWAANALFGATADEAFDVEVAAVNTPTTIQAGELHAAVELSLTPHTEKVVIDVVTNIAEGVAA